MPTKLRRKHSMIEWNRYGQTPDGTVTQMNTLVLGLNGNVLVLWTPLTNLVTIVQTTIDYENGNHSNLFSLRMDGASCSYNHLFIHNMIASSVKLHFSHVVNIQPWLLLKILGEEFISAQIDDCLFYNEVGNLQFGKLAGKLYEDEGNFYIRFEDGRVFAVTPEQ